MTSLPGMTIGRLVSVCGAIGVSTSASTRGMHDRPAGRQVVGRRSGGAGDDQAVGLDLRHEPVPTDTDSSMIRDSAALVNTTSLSTMRESKRSRVAVRVGGEHRALVEGRGAVEDRSSDGRARRCASR